LTSIAAKPSRLSHLEAATVPIGALTAWQGLFERAKLKTGERILIHNGSGAVGVFAIQLARRAGAHVITTASARNSDFLSQVGANEVIDYRMDRFEDRARDLDVVFDAVGGETLKRSWSLLKPRGRMVTIAAKSEGPKGERMVALTLIWHRYLGRCLKHENNTETKNENPHPLLLPLRARFQTGASCQRRH
jgi:NADPH:quinone reductase-like Zn-dependent oxidoreductase